MKIAFFLFLIIGFCTSCASKYELENGEFDVELDGLMINYSVKGTGPIMIVGHLYSGKTGYEMTMQQLEDQFTMVYYSPRGTGNSEEPEQIENYQYEYLVEEIDLLRNHLNQESIWLFGHSDQSEIALQYTVDHPNNVAGLILSGTHFVENAEIEKIEKARFENERKEQLWFRQVVADISYRNTFQTSTDSTGRDLTYAPLKWWCYDSLSAEKVIPIYEAINQAGRRKPVNGKYAFTTQTERDQLANRTAEYQSRYGSINVPVLIIQGRLDTNNPPKFVRKLQSSLLNSELIFMEESGHFPWVEQPTASFTQIYEWLDKIEAD